MICAIEQEFVGLLVMMVGIHLDMGVHVLVQDLVHVLPTIALLLEHDRHLGHTLLHQDGRVITLLPQGGIQTVQGPQGIIQKDVMRIIIADHCLGGTVVITKIKLTMVMQERIYMTMTGDALVRDLQDAPQVHRLVRDPDLRTYPQGEADRGRESMHACTLFLWCILLSLGFEPS